jgi:hypothetical protein
MADSVESPTPKKAPATPTDFFAVRRGRATPEQDERVKRALADHNSDLSQWVTRAQSFARASFGIQDLLRDALIVERYRAAARRQYNGVNDFLNQLQAKGTISADEFPRIKAAGEIHPNASGQVTPESYGLAARNMIKLMLELHPQLADLANQRGDHRSH